MEALRGILKQYWGYDSFLPLQTEAMQSVMAGLDSVVVLPTGGGKSLCFQAPAVAMDGMAIVVSPLLSLMKDQVDALQANGVPAAKVDSTMSPAAQDAVYEDIAARKLKLLYISPERVVKPRFIAYLRDVEVSFLVVDEAHCISHWGHDFRPEYRELRTLREALPGKAIHAYTATATEHVREDIVRELCLRDANVLVGSFDRSNLNYRVSRRSRGFGQVLDIVEERTGESGIVYCIRRADVDTLCKQLKKAGHKALPYHAGMSDLARKRNQEAFSKEDVDVVVATVAFGMGIDKSNVRYIVHAAMPKSLEYYHQETGRAGRDGLPADCWLLYSYQDLRIWEFIVRKNAVDAPEAAEIAAEKLQDMFAYCERPVCRHKAIVSYFGETYPDRPCGACDVCQPQSVDAIENTAEVSQTILSCVTELGAIAGPTYTTLILTGSKEERVLAKGHDHLKNYGALASTDSKNVRDWIEQIVRQGYLEKTGEYNILSLTPKGAAALCGEETPQLAKPFKKTAKKTQTRKARSDKGLKPLALSKEPYDRQLFEILRQTRRAMAQELNVPPFVIFSDAALRDMARRKPQNHIDFLGIHGVGKKKCQAFGDQFIQVIREYDETQPK